MKFKSHQKWSWILIVTFFALSILNIYFGFLGILCMTIPIYHALRGRGKVHCSHYCPRGSFLGKFLEKISLQKKLPDSLRTSKFKNIVLIFMISMFTLSLILSNGEMEKIAMSIVRLMFASFVLGIILGIFYKPRAWCQICPMGHATSIIAKKIK